MKNNLSDGWDWTTIGEICETASGGTPRRKKSVYYNGEIPWLKSGELNDSIIYTAQESITELGLRNSSAKVFKKGDILIALYGATVGKLGILSISASTNQAICAIRTPTILEKKYLFWFLKYKRSALLKKRMGGAQPNISQQIIRNTELPLPPLPEQHRIVAKIDELFTKLDAGVDALKQVQAQLKWYRQSVLKAATEGRLTAEWREQHKDELEPAVKLLQRIQDEQKAKLGKKYKEPKPIDTSDLPKLPEKWEWARIKDVSSRVTVGHVGPMINEYIDNGIPFLRSQNVRANKFDPNNLKYIDIQFHKKLIKSSLNPNDVVIVRSGNVGISCVIPNLLKEANCADLVIVKKPIGIIPELLSIYMNSVTQSRISKHKVGVALTHFNTQSVASFPIPIPPIIEQRRIVQNIENRFSIVDAVEDTIYQRLKQAQALRQSILKRAFEGKLVPQDPKDEPASVLLERIKAEKAETNQSKQLEMS